jgi:predicted Zn-dependent protease
MSNTSPNSNPLKPSFKKRLGNWVRTFPRWMLWAVGLSTAVLVVSGAGVFTWKVLKNRRQNAINEQWERFERALRTGADEEELQAAVAGVLALDPANDRAKRYEQALETGEGDKSDSAVCVLTMFQHLRKGALPEAAREARKRLAIEPNDWLARCVVAQAALAAGDRAAATAELDRLPDPKKVPPSPGAMRFAYDLYLRTGRDPTVFRRFVGDAVVDVLGSVSLEKHNAATKLQFLECYLLGFQGGQEKKLEERLALGATPAGKLADQAFQQASEANDEGQLVALGHVCNRLTEALALLLRDKQITPEQHAGLTHEYEQRVGRVWAAVRERFPKQPAAYHVLALWHTRGGRPTEARDVVVTGLKECGDNSQLLALYSQMLIREDKAADATAMLFAAAAKEPDNFILWLLTAETANAANRRDIALEACKRARKAAPNHPIALRTEAAIYLSVGRPNEAVQLLSQLGDDFLLAEPRLARAYVRSLVAAGLNVTAPQFLAAAEAAAFKADNPFPAVSAVSGLFDARYDETLSKLGGEVVQRLSARWPSDHGVLAVRALLLEQAAEYAHPRWEPGRVREAVFALERVKAGQSDDRDLAALLAWVRLKGANDPAAALRDAAPLAAAQDRGEPLVGLQSAVLGAVYVANKRPDDAVKVLELARKSGVATATGSIHLALAYHALGQAEKARAALDDARTRPMSDQDTADFASAQATILREKP